MEVTVRNPKIGSLLTNHSGVRERCRQGHTPKLTSKVLGEFMKNQNTVNLGRQSGMRLLRIHIAAKRIGRSPLTLRRWIQQGKLRAFRLNGRSWGIYDADIDLLGTFAEGTW